MQTSAARKHQCIAASAPAASAAPAPAENGKSGCIKKDGGKGEVRGPGVEEDNSSKLESGSGLGQLRAVLPSTWETGRCVEDR